MAKVMPYPQRVEWLLREIKANRGADVLDAAFVEAYAAETNAKIKFAMWGAGWCSLLSSDLSRMHKSRLLKRMPTGLSSGAWQPGFPKWVYVYRISGIGQDALSEPTR